ncbi:hypothetical protein RIF29_26234 [Crotalaria pallida]|uniref:non-specific serine/threonine protein kinase n=1 Tax=Crotalaria pallida TaxID=3830 RepID=A0AAN9EUR6_CROPI
MPSRPPPSPPSSSPPLPLHHHHHNQLLLIILATSLALFLLSLLITLSIFLYRKLSYNRTTPFDTHHHHHRRFSYSVLRRATNSFSPSTKLGHGGFGSVHKATLPSGQTVALKLMSSPGSLQGEREFHNELSLSSHLHSPFILSLLGFSSDRRRRKLLLVYELMPNRSLQDALLDRKCPELMEWSTRFNVAVSVAKGLEYLHHCCHPPVIHGDIKPSNILLDSDFNAKIGDFGLARVKSVEDDLEMVDENSNNNNNDNGRGGEEKVIDVAEDCESVITINTNSNTNLWFEEDSNTNLDRLDSSPVAVSLPASEMGVDKSSVVSELSVDSGKDLIKKKGGGGGGGSGRDWWWKQDNVGGSESGGRVKDYVMEWIGSEIKKERPKNEWIAAASTASAAGGEAAEARKESKNKERKRLDWWASLDEDKVKAKKNRKPREWWKEEFCEELSKKSKKKKRSLDAESWWQKDEDLVEQRKKKKRNSKSSRGSIDWWLDGLSGEIRNNGGRRNSQDWVSGDIPKSGGISSTPSMRGTVCYIAPEYGGGGQLSEKCDVYSFGVLLLVLIAGRRPLQVTASPMSEFERANLISWARQLAHNGRLLDLVDTNIHSLDKEQALLCVTIALLCLQRSPAKRPSMKEIVGMLSGQSEPPHLPFEFSPSPPSNFPFKSRKKAR